MSKLHASSCTCVACMFTTAGLELTTSHESKGWQLQTTLVDCVFEHYSTCTCNNSKDQFYRGSGAEILNIGELQYSAVSTTTAATAITCQTTTTCQEKRHQPQRNKLQEQRTGQQQTQ